MNIDELFSQALDVLKKLITIPSFSTQEKASADAIEKWVTDRGMVCSREKNNIWLKNKYFSVDKPTILLNSHHDTVRPNLHYTKNPWDPDMENGKLYGLGSNDAGGSLVALMVVFWYFYKTKLSHNIILALTAEEEKSGKDGMRRLFPLLPKLSFAIIGEPTDMKLAVAEKGLMVIDGYSSDKGGHAAHQETENAIYKAMEDIEWIKNFTFSKISPWLGEVKMTVTQIQAGTQHNLMPQKCHFVVDIRVNDRYENEEIYHILSQKMKSKISARSLDLKPSFISMTHPIIKASKELDIELYGSATLSDQALVRCPSVKIGPGSSLRSHMADEFIYLKQIKDGINTYIQLLKKII